MHRREIWVQIPRGGEAADKQQHPDRFRRSDGALLVPQTQAIVAAVCEEVDLAGGQIADCHDDGRRLFLRATVPIAEEVRPGDIIQEGIAVAAGNAEVKIRHFVYRQVCRNGAVIPQSISGQSFSRVEGDTSSHLVTEILAGIRDAVQQCLNNRVFETVASHIRATSQRQAERSLLSFLRRSLRTSVQAPRIRAEILRRFNAEGDKSVFGLMNAVTSTARDESNPEVRWTMEELGGEIALLGRPTTPGYSRTTDDADKRRKVRR